MEQANNSRPPRGANIARRVIELEARVRALELLVAEPNEGTEYGERHEREQQSGDQTEIW